MRISDWSSDVCSSDLDHDLRSFLARLESTGQLQRVGAPVDPELESTALCLRALREGGPALLMEHPVGSDHPLLGNLFGHRDRIEAVLAGRPLASLRELGELLAARSEEHTAELQSLMRISYAVFCLKNKHRHTAGKK